MPVSPGVYIREYDFSDYAPQLGVTNPAILGGATKGPVGVPTLVQTEADLVRLFGPPVLNDYGLQCAVQYLKQGNQLNYVRVARSPFTATVNVPGALNGTPAISATGTITFSVAGSSPSDAATVTIPIGSTNFVFEFDSNSTYTAGNIPVAIGSTPGVTLDNLSAAIQQNVAAVSVTNTTVTTPTLLITVIIAGTGGNANMTASGTGVSVTGLSGGVAATSGTLAAAMTLSAISPGSWANGMQVQVITPSTAINSSLASFDLLVFGVATSGSNTLVERFSNLVLDSSASNYIVTALTQGITNLMGPSAYIAATPLAGATNLVAGTYTFGQSGAFASGSVALGGLPADTGTVTINDGVSTVIFEFDSNSAVTAGNVAVTIGGTAIITATSLCTAINAYPGFLVTASNAGGTLSTVTLTNDKIGTNGNVAVTKGGVTTNITVTGMTGGTGAYGTDGITGLIAADYIGTVNGQVATGLQSIRNAETLDINLLAIPGLANISVINAALAIAANRGDFLVLIDPPFALSVDSVVSWTNGSSALANAPGAALDNSYGAVFWPWVQVTDAYSGKTIWLPPSGSVLAAFAYNDRTAGPWYAAAGAVRGGISANKIEYSASQTERDTLIGSQTNNRVNPIVNLHNRGITIYGNRTTQRRPSALDSIHVRRMILHAEKVCATAVSYLVFNPNDSQTWREFSDRVNKILGAIKAARGLADFRVICDETTNPPAQISQHVMRAKMILQAQDAAEILQLDFGILANGADFSTANF